MHITIKSRQRAEGETVFVVPAMSLATPEGERMIPNPSGLKPLLYAQLEEAVSAAHRAGFDAEYEGQWFGLNRDRATGSRSTAGLTGQGIHLVEQGLEKAYPILLKRLKDKETLVLVASIQALGYSQNPETIHAFLPLLAHESSDVRNAIQNACSHLPLLPTLQALASIYGKSVVEHRHAEAAQRERLTILKSWDAMAKLHPTEQFAPVMSHALHALEEEQWLIRGAAASFIHTLQERRSRERLEDTPSRKKVI
jgi:HEAT repeat protein